MLRRFTQHAFVRNALSLYGIQVASYVLPLLTFPYLARVLGAEKFGLIAWSQAFVSYFLTITEYGFNFSVVRQVSLARDRPEELNSIYSAAMAARFLLLFGCFALLTGIVAAVPKFRAEWLLFYINFLTVVGVALFPQWLFQGLERMGFITVREIGARIIGLLFIFLLVRTSQDYLWAAAVMSGSTAIGGLIGLLYVPKLTGVRFTKTSWPEIVTVLREGWHVFLSTASISVYSKSNVVILGLMAPQAEVGVFAAAQRLVEAAKLLVFPMTNSLYPHVSRLPRTEAIAFIRKSLPRVLVPFAAISFGLGVLAPLGIHVLFGQKYQAAIPLLQVMAPTPLIVAAGACFATLFMLGLGYKRQWSNMIIGAAAFNFVVLLPLLYFIRPTYAVAITSVLVEAFVTAISYAFWRRHMDGRSNPDIVDA